MFKIYSKQKIWKKLFFKMFITPIVSRLLVGRVLIHFNFPRPSTATSDSQKKALIFKLLNFIKR